MVHTVLGTSYHDMPFISNIKIDLIYLIQYASQIHTLKVKEL